jgi:hypothetical protein
VLLGDQRQGERNRSPPHKVNPAASRRQARKGSKRKQNLAPSELSARLAPKDCVHYYRTSVHNRLLLSDNTGQSKHSQTISYS